MIDWNIQSRAHACQSCQTPFVEKAPIHTLLSDERNGYERFDICEACWSTQFSHGATDRKGFVSHWSGPYSPPPASPPDPIQRETAETLLRKLIELNDPSHEGACFILSAMLERKRLLKVKAQLTRDGRRIFVYEHPATGDIFNVVDPNLQLDQLEAVQRDVAELLKHGLAGGDSAPAGSAAPPPETPTEIQPTAPDGSSEPSHSPEQASDESPVAATDSDPR